LVGIRFTTARADAQRALGVLLRQWSQGPDIAQAEHRSLRTPLPGGEIESFDLFRSAAREHAPRAISGASLEGLLRNFGTEYRKVLSSEASNVEVSGVVPGTSTLLAEIDYAVKNEMATCVDDVVMRRTNLAAGRHPGSAALQVVADRMAPLLRWSDTQAADEVRKADDNLRKHRARESVDASPRQDAHRNVERLFA
jgi:glycerol-3-phosphate dehydrogenase